MAKSFLEKRLIRYEDLIPCKAAFIDAKTPGSDRKDNYSIIGGGVSESTHQKVNLTELHGFCIGAAGQPPRVKNSPHSHFTAEVFMVYSGVWRFYWNNDDKTETIVHPGDIISLPTNMFRGFENVGDEYGMIFSILGHDNAGGGVVWAPRVIEEAKDHGLVLLENGKLVDTTIGEKIPKGKKPMRPLTKTQLKKFDQYTVRQMSPHVGRAGTYKASPYKGFPNKTPDQLRWIDVLGPQKSKGHKFQVKPGDPKGDQFNVYGLQADGKGKTGKYKREEVEVMLVHRGKFQISCTHKGKTLKATLKNGDIFTFPKGSERSITANTYGFAYFVVGEDYPAAPELLT
ncbi:MAG: mannose-6-phosphate isomerase-like protein (cupin superfamily) [Polaribacter sp.]|jgi:mannose-6-phosphate isomerase-like protein (cupin superfamily)